MAESESSWSIPQSLELNADYVHPVGRVALLSPGAASGSSDPMAACRTQPPWRGWGQRWDWVSLATPGPVCLTSLACFSGVISAQWGLWWASCVWYLGGLSSTGVLPAAQAGCSTAQNGGLAVPPAKNECQSWLVVLHS